MSRPSRPTARPAARPASRPRWLLPVALVVVLLAAAAVWWMVSRPTPLPTFSEQRAYSLVEEQVAFGPRVPGTAAHDAARQWLVSDLGMRADRIVEQRVALPLPSGDTLRGSNIIASWNLDAPRRILLSAHWDSRPVADNDPDPLLRDRPVPGANDGASGVAVLLEIARLLEEHDRDAETGVDIVLFDLEDLGTIDPAVPDSLRLPFAIGSEIFVRDNPQYRPAWGVLLDMVGDADLRLPQEGYSVQHAPAVVERVWAAARRAGAPAFVDEVGPPIQDDHVPFLRQSIPVIDLIQTPFPDTWHTTSDTPANVSAESLGQVGRVLVELLWGED